LRSVLLLPKMTGTTTIAPVFGLIATPDHNLSLWFA
jgi:hypothetical protein